MKQVFEQAVTLAACSNAPIIVLHVMEESSRFAEKQVRMAFGEQLYQDIKNEHKTGARNILIGKNVDALRIRQAIAGFFQEGEEKNAPSGEDSPIEKILVMESRSAADDITATAIEEGCDLIVMGCKQQGMLADAMGNNLVRKVLKRTHVPVVVVPFK